MRGLRRHLAAAFAVAALVAGCTTGFDLRARPADGALVDAGSDAAAADDAVDGAAADAGVCRAPGDRCCAEAARGAFCVAGLVCSEGYCAPCPNNLFACGNACVDLQTSGRHCGVCGTVCAEGQRCAGGTCAADCPPPGTVCDGRCVTLQSDDAHCSACGRSCVAAAGPNAVGRCVAGACQRACAPGFGDCDGEAANGCEVDTRASVTHCGACGQACAPPRAVGACAAGACVLARCEAGYGDCDGALGNGCEVDVRRDTAHCGACGHACAPGQSCRDGLCLATGVTCAAGTADCRDDVVGCETPTRSDAMNCGACGRACAFPNAAATCAAGVCARGACAAGFADCDAAEANGCEVRTASDLAHCGACGRACAAANAQPACVGGACAIAACAPGFADCDRGAGNGCEVDTRSSATHCGACGQACTLPNAAAACVAGRCAIGSCRAGFADCDGSASNGCEVNLGADPVNCGACASLCAFPNAAASCAGGACSLGACAEAYRNCDGLASNGCETHVATSTASCGACGRACAFPNASATCAAGVCVLGACAAGWGDCDGDPANGCEASLGASASCGACGRACPPGQRCSGGACAIECAPGETVCGGACVDLNASASHCGRCGNACPAGPNETAACTEGVCRRRCVAPYGNCDGASANGCEVDLGVDPGHCGACSVSCGTPRNATALCERSTCVLACAGGYRDCDGEPTNGCEAAINTDAANCGRCGLACPPPSNARLHTTTSACAGGDCAFQCEPGWADCNQQDADGCEASLRSVEHCGSCTTSCPGDVLSPATCCNTNSGPLCCRYVTLALVCGSTVMVAACR